MRAQGKPLSDFVKQKIVVVGATSVMTQLLRMHSYAVMIQFLRMQIYVGRDSLLC